METEEERAKLTSKERNALPKSAFAYVDADGVGHFPIHDANHVRNALARIAQGAKYGKEALPKVKAAAKKFGIDSDSQRSIADLALSLLEEERELPVWFVETEPAAEGESEERAAKATYEDVETCGECGATGQYGKHCTACGSSMAPPTANHHGDFCANCGGKMPAKRDEHVCDAEERADTASGTTSAQPDQSDEDDEDDSGKGEEGEERAGEDAEADDGEERTDAPEPGREGELPGGKGLPECREGETSVRHRWLELMSKRHDPYED